MEAWLAGFDGSPQDPRLVHIGIFLAALIDATGLPFPGRVVLITAGATAGKDWGHVATLVAAGALGAVVGDHIWYSRRVPRRGRSPDGALLQALARLGAMRETCARSFRALRPVRHHHRAVRRGRQDPRRAVDQPCISYPRYLLFEVAGAVTWSATFVVLGWLLGAQWRALMERYGVGNILVAVVAITICGAAAIVAVRLIRVRRHGRAVSSGPPPRRPERSPPGGGAHEMRRMAVQSGSAPLAKPGRSSEPIPSLPPSILTRTAPWLSS